MKRLPSVFASLAIVLVVGCATLEKKAYVSLGATTVAVELAREAYIQHANECLCVTSSEYQKVQADYETYQASVKVAEDAVLAWKSADVGNEAALTAAINAVSASASDIIVLVRKLLPRPEADRLNKKLRKGLQ